MRNIGIDADRLWATTLQMGEIGATVKGGCHRLALTDEDRRARDLFSAWMREAGFRQTRVEHLSGPDSMVVGVK